MVRKVDGLKDTGMISILEVKEGGVNDQTIVSRGSAKFRVMLNPIECMTRTSS